MKKTIILGANSFIAQHLRFDKIADRVKASDSQIEHLLDVYKPDVIINCVGKTGSPNIDSLESPDKIGSTIETNVAIPILLANIADKKSIKLIQISSGCIFYGQSPNFANGFDSGWTEKDFANPVSAYSKSKYACDLALSNMRNTTSLRIRMPVSGKHSPRNLINKLLNYTHVLDVKNSMTFLSDLPRAIDFFIDRDLPGVWHLTNDEALSPSDVMKEYQQYIREHKFTTINDVELDNITVAKRSNCHLNTDKLKAAGFIMTPSHEALKETMASFIKNENK